MGVAQGMQFENWMYYLIEGIEDGKRKFDWAGIICENLELQLRTVQNQKQFYVGSYLFYLIARRRKLKSEFGGRENFTEERIGRKTFEDI